MLTYPKSHFSENHISAPIGCCDLQFVHTLENDQVLLAHLSAGDGGFFTIFFKGGLKIGLKCKKLALITLDLRV